VAMMGGGTVLIHIAVLLLAFAVAWALTLVMPAPIAFVLTAALVGGGGALLIYRGRERLKKESLKPQITINHLQEDQQWAKEMMQRVRSNLRHDT
jgi:hypothetical protein